MSKNYNETIRNSIAASGGSSQTSVISSVTDIKILDEKIYDTSSSANAFAALSAGDVIYMEGWDEDENNRVFTVTEVESAGEYIKVDKELKDVKEADIPSAGITMYKSPESLTVSGITVDDVITDVVNFNTAASSSAELDKKYFAVTAADTVANFAVVDSGDSLMISWAQMSAG